VATKSGLELPQWLDLTAYRNHRETLDYCYENGWYAGIVLTVDSFLRSWAQEELTQEDDISYQVIDEGFEIPHFDNGVQIDFNEYYDLLTERRDYDINFDSLEAELSTVLSDLSFLRNNIAHGNAYFGTNQLADDGSFREYDENLSLQSGPDDFIRIYEEILQIPERDSLTDGEIGNAERILDPQGDIQTLASGMYHGVSDNLISELNRHGYTTRYNPAQPVSSIMIYNWLESDIPRRIQELYEREDLNQDILPDEVPGETGSTGEYITLSDWINHEIIGEPDILPHSTYPNALEEPIEQIHEFEQVRNQLAHDVNYFSEVHNLETRDIIWHGYEIMHRLSDRAGSPTNRIELFGEEADEQRRAEPYMLKGERLSRWP